MKGGGRCVRLFTESCMTSSRRFGFLSLRCSAKHNKASVVKATDLHLQIYNQAIKYFAMESLKKCKIMDCHENQRFSRNGTKFSFMSLRGSAKHNEAIYTSTRKSLRWNFSNMLDYGLPQDSNESRARTEW